MDQVGTSEWPNIENLKIASLHRLTIFLYNFLKYKYSTNEKNLQENSFRAFENLAKCIEIYLEMTSLEINEDSLITIFNEFYNSYTKARKHTTHHERVKEDMEAIIDMLNEETSKVILIIQGLNI